MRAAIFGMALVAAACSGQGNGTSTLDAGPTAPTATTVPTVTVALVGGDRPARLVVPPGLGESKDPVPLVIVLHGYGAGGELQDVYLGVSTRGEEFEYLTLTPDGTTDPGGNRFWNVFDAGFGPDDTAYLSGLIDEAVIGYNADPARVYVVGHSNGGFMAHKLACDLPGRIAGIASIAGGILGLGADCPTPVGVLMIQGTDDATVPYEGGVFLGGRILGAEETAARWVELDGCADRTTIEGPYDFDLLVPGSETTVTAWRECDGATSVELWMMTGSGHIPGFRPVFRDAMMERLVEFPPAQAE